MKRSVSNKSFANRCGLIDNDVITKQSEAIRQDPFVRKIEESDVFARLAEKRL